MVYLSRDKDPVLVPRDQVKIGQCFANIDRVTKKPDTIRFAHFGSYKNSLHSVNLDDNTFQVSQLPAVRLVALVGRYVLRGFLLPKDAIKTIAVDKLAAGDMFSVVMTSSEKPKPHALLKILSPGILTATHSLQCFSFDNDLPRLDQISVGAEVFKIGMYTIEAEVI